MPETTMAHTTVQLQQDLSSSSSIQITNLSISCFPPAIILIPSTSSLSSPMQFRRDQDFYFSSYIQLSCHTSLSTITRWTIYNCTPTNCSSQIQTDQTNPTTFSELYIPARTLPYGTYQLKLTVTMTASPNSISSSSAYVRITSSGITANLVQYGTSMITRGYQQDLLLDPGTYSLDPDQTTFNATVSRSHSSDSFDWYSFDRIGNTLTIVESMIAMIFPISMVLCCPLMIAVSI